MAAGVQIRGWSGPSRRRVPRFQMQAPLDVTVLRSGIPDTVPGRAVDVCERGIAAMLAGVRHQDRLRCGLEFVGLSVEQRAAIRDWAKESKAETEMGASSAPAVE